MTYLDFDTSTHNTTRAITVIVKQATITDGDNDEQFYNNKAYLFDNRRPPNVANHTRSIGLRSFVKAYDCLAVVTSKVAGWALLWSMATPLWMPFACFVSDVWRKQYKNFLNFQFLLNITIIFSTFHRSAVYSEKNAIRIETAFDITNNALKKWGIMVLLL